jgi:hypothetical protein
MFKNRISIRVERNLITFTKGYKSISLPPYVCTDDASVVLSVGEPALSTGKSIRINLFEEPQSPNGYGDYGDILVAFLRHGIAVLLGRTLFRLRPSFDFFVSPDVAVFLRRYHKSVFSDAAIRSGAISVTVAVA